MLGTGSLSSRSVSGSPYKLIGYTASLALTAGFVFGSSMVWGSRLPMGMSAGVTFGSSAAWTTRNALTATGRLTLGTNARLILLGRTITFKALPQPASFTAQRASYSFTPRAESYTFKGTIR